MVDDFESRIEQILGKVKKRTEELEQEQPQQVVTSEIAVKSPAVEKVGGGRRWLLAGAGVIVVVLGLVGVISFGTSRNMGVGFISVMALFGGAVLVYYGMKKKEESVFMAPGGRKRKAVVANCLTIYPDRVEFDECDDSTFEHHPRKCRNDNKYYYVNIWGTAWGIGQNKMVPFVLPDTAYRDPREFANNLNIPAHRRLAQRRASTFEKISPFLLIAGMGIVAFLFVAL